MSVSQRLQKAKSAQRKGDTEAAKELCAAILAEFPSNPKARALMASLSGRARKKGPAPADVVAPLRAACDTGDHAAALRLGDEILAVYPACFDTLGQVGGAAYATKAYARGAKAFEAMAKQQPNHPDVIYNLGTCYMGLGAPEQAAAHFRKVLVAQPRNARALYNLGNCLSQLGQMEAAAAQFKKTIQANPDHLKAYSNLAEITPLSLASPEAAHLTARLKDGGLPAADRVLAHFFLAKAAETDGAYETAYHHFTAGNEQRRENVGYDPARDARLAKATATAAQAIQDADFEVKGTAPVRPIFILGMPRSGTTLFEQTLSCHSRITAGGELPHVPLLGQSLYQGRRPVSPDALADFRQGYLDALAQISEGAGFVTDKLPANFWALALIQKALPEAVIFHMTRNPQAVCWSNFKHNFTVDSLGYTCRVTDTLAYYRLYEEHMHRQPAMVQAKISEINYETLTQDHRRVTEGALAHIGVAWEDACLKPHRNERVAKTASKHQVRQEVYQGSSGKWRNYEAFLPDAFLKFKAAAAPETIG